MENSPFPMVPYGVGKAAAHYLRKKIHCESPGLAAFVVDPGFMQTDTGNTGARNFGYHQAFLPVDVAVDFTFAQEKEQESKPQANSSLLTKRENSMNGS
ncbi:hypothetical protein F5Y19DRAFT_472886 [Xylariaceae sp. FL1651]|nr:hypothetical protein F5Y19DRAFT_472886 [Xylariaceae sp. FL1651]